MLSYQLFISCAQNTSKILQLLELRTRLFTYSNHRTNILDFGKMTCSMHCREIHFLCFKYCLQACTHTHIKASSALCKINKENNGYTLFCVYLEFKMHNECTI